MHLDWRGNEIKIGSIIIYVVTYSSSVKLVEGRVVRIRDEEYITNWQNKKRTFSLDVEPIRDNSHGYIRERKDEVRITAVERVTVVG